MASAHPSFEIVYHRLCPFCLDTAPDDDHHCAGSDVVVNELRNRLDDERELQDKLPLAYCTHDDILARRPKYLLKNAERLARRSRHNDTHK
jgi:hypothetical protein